MRQLSKNRDATNLDRRIGVRYISNLPQTNWVPLVRVRHYCGCCGREIGECDLWCRDCSGHVSKDRTLPLCDRTYEVQNDGEGCPFALFGGETA